jgi:AcrR family transcriptional regulator
MSRESSAERPSPGRSPRTDARRNAQRIVTVATDVFSTVGVDVSIEKIARTAGVGPATLYRHFANKDELIRAVLRQAFADNVEPALRTATEDEPDAFTGLVTALRAAVAMAAGQRNALAASKRPGQMPLDLAPVFFTRLAPILIKAQEQGSVRADVEPADLPQLLSMLLSTMWFDESEVGWRRYLGLLLDALRPNAATPLPPLLRSNPDGQLPE